MDTIVSKDNPVFRRLAALRSGKADLSDSSRVLLEGFRLCEEALRSHCEARMVVFDEKAVGVPGFHAITPLLPEGVRPVVLSDALFQRLSATRTPQGVMLLCDSPCIHGLPGLPRPNGRYLVLEEVRDPGNLGTMIRTADAAGLDGIVLTPGCVDPFNDKSLRASMGSVFHLPLHTATIDETADWLRAGGLPMVAADLSGEDLFRVGIPGRGAVLVGNEGSGLSEHALARCTHRTRIPMPGRAESLNAAAAAAVLMYGMLKASGEGSVDAVDREAQG